MTSNSLCDNCIHKNVCKLCQDDNICKPTAFCVDQLPREVVGFIRRSNGLLLSDVVPYIKCKYFTIVVITGETCNSDTYDNPANYRVSAIDYDPTEQKIVIGVIPFKEN